MPERTGGKDYPIRWPRSASIAYVLLLLLVVSSVALFGLLRANGRSSVLDFVLAQWPIVLEASLFGALIINGILIFQDVRRSTRKPPLTKNQKRFRVAVWSMPLWTLALITYIVWKPAGILWTVLGFAIYAAGIGAASLVARVPEDERLELEKREIEFMDEMQFTKDNPDPRAFLP